jgi:hypothetical protein
VALVFGLTVAKVTRGDMQLPKSQAVSQ